MQSALLKKLYSLENLELAFNRLMTGQNIEYKNYYRETFLAYQFFKWENLKCLSDRLKGLSYTPSDILRFYVPKQSGLHRPVSILHLDDLIVYQAFANIVADLSRDKRILVERDVVFSNLYARNNPKSIFFFERWEDSYHSFLNCLTKQFNEGNIWVAHFDLASYFDTISHDNLAYQINRSNNDFKSILLDCFREWSTIKNQKLDHGIPQGPISSYLFGEVFILPVDIMMQKRKIKYARYVDDIRIFGESREEVLDGIILLEKEFKEKGLIPQVNKCDVKKCKNSTEAIGKLPSFTTFDKSSIINGRARSTELFKSSFDPNNFDVSRVRYILKTSPKNDDILRIVLENLNQYPDLVSEFCIFLKNYVDNAKVGRDIYTKALQDPSNYEYVEGKYWELLSSFDFGREEKTRYVNEAIRRLIISKNRHNYALKLGLYFFLASTKNSLVLKWLRNESSSLIQMIIVGGLDPICLNFKPFQIEYLKFMSVLLNRNNYEPFLVGIKNLYYSNNSSLIKTLKDLCIDNSGIITILLGKPLNVDPIGQIITKQYKVPYYDKWHKFLKQEYSFANEIMFLANNSFYIDRNSWCGYTDSFNEIILIKFIQLLNSKKPVKGGWSKLVDVQGKKIDYGVLLDSKNKLSINYPSIADSFRNFHSRRCKIPSSHAYDKKTGSRATIVTCKEQRNLVKILKSAYTSLITELRTLLQ